MTIATKEKTHIFDVPPKNRLGQKFNISSNVHAMFIQCLYNVCTMSGPKASHLESPDRVQTDPKMDPASLIRSTRGITLDNAMHSLEVTAILFFNFTNP